ncbi:MAG: S41 family peptidase [Leptospiraceae bacterium]|nr:S41 family peptidase [Leptospiraceae bacterium]
MKKLQRTSHLGILLLLSLFLNVVLALAPLSADSEQEGTQRYQYILQTLLHYMDAYFVEEVATDKLMEGAVRGLLAAGQDPYTRFLNADEMKQFMGMEGGSRIGIGVELVLEAGEPLILAPMPGGPAMRAGIRPRDIIEAVDGTETRGLDIGRLSQLVTGERGTPVRLRIRREGFDESLEIEVIRGEFQMDYVRTHWFAKEQLGYIQLTHFFGEESGSVRDFEKALQSFSNRRARGLILDLRDNTGGHLDMAAHLAGLFVKKGAAIVEARGRFQEWNRTLYATEENAGRYQNLPMVVLINNSSASASEIMAGALQDHARARLLGEQSFGKASVQRIFRDLPGNAGALITIQKYYTPKGRQIHGKGLKPDILVPSWQASRAESFYHYQMNKAGVFAAFKKQHPNYQSGLPAVFQADMQKRGWPISAEFALRLMKQHYHESSGELDPQTDTQLQRALAELSR